MSQKTIIIIFTFLAIAFIALYFCNFNGDLSPQQTDWGTFGDYIGGILGTLLSGLTIYFIYTTYQSQNSQLEILRREASIRDIDLQYDRIINSINEISFKGKKGVEAMLAWDDSHKDVNRGSNVVNMLNLIIHAFNDHINTILESKAITAKEKANFYDRAYLMLHAMLIWPVLEKIYDCESFKNHTDNLKTNFDKLIGEVYDYLVERTKLLEPDEPRITKLWPPEKKSITTIEVLKQIKAVN